MQEQLHPHPLARKMLAAYAGIAVAGAGIAGCTSEAPPSPVEITTTVTAPPPAPVTVTARPTATVTVSVPETCNPTPTTSMDAVDALLAKPGVNIANLPFSAAEPVLQHTASTLGLHRIYSKQLSDSSVFQGPISTKEGQLYADPFSYYLGLTRSLMAQFGVQVDIGTVASDNPYTSSRTPTAKELETTTAKADVLNIALAYNGDPKEFVETEGLKRIQLVIGTKGAVAYAVMGGPDNTIYADIGNRLDTAAYQHETAHLLDTKECGSPAQASNDPEFTDLNTVPNPYSQNKLFSLNDYATRVDEAEKKVFTLNGAGTLIPSEWCGFVSLTNSLAPKVQTFTDYHTNVVEDKAETEKNISVPYAYSTLTNPKFKVLYSKFKLALARLYTIDPKSTQYFIETRYPPQSNVPSNAPTC